MRDISFYEVQLYAMLKYTMGIEHEQPRIPPIEFVEERLMRVSWVEARLILRNLKSVSIEYLNDLEEDLAEALGPDEDADDEETDTTPSLPYVDLSDFHVGSLKMYYTSPDIDGVEERPPHERFQCATRLASDFTEFRRSRGMPYHIDGIT